ncbi:MAG: lytic transglycosylase domain-containing protein [Candidatus Methanofastidiosum sp.]|nr:lytic transglycosylase domain-containing protein [Methanofastidiosum sp.]
MHWLPCRSQCILFCFVLFLPLLLLFFPSFPDSAEYNRYNTSYEQISQCIQSAGNYYRVNPLLLWGIAKVESGFNPFALNKNANGTYDIGIMQINSSWIPTLKNYGLYDTKQLWDPCYNIYVGAWVLKQCIDRHGYTWEAVGCYNAVSTTKRVKYANKVYKVLEPYLKKQ